MYGTKVAAAPVDALDRLEALLDRRLPIDPVNALRSALNYGHHQQVELGKIAIGIDSSVFLRLATHPKSADILDYLPLHSAPLILPGQAIQEFWNNRLSVVQTVSSSVKKNFDQLAKDARRVDAQFDEFEQHISGMLQDFESRFGYIYDENTRNSVAKMLDILKDQAYCYFVPRNRFQPIAQIRNRTMTPPGFKDNGDGDFFVWADFLLGLLMCTASEKSASFDKVVLLTIDQKPDWSTHGTPHPILTAEVHALFGAPFDLWTLEEFVSEVQQVVGS